MSENIPESIPTSHDHRSHRPAKKARAGPPTLTSTQSSAIEALFAKQPDIQLPTTALARTTASLAPPPEIVANVQGSSAGAGSGEFHVYKASRRREYERIKLMEEEAQAEEDNRRWAAERAERERRDAEKGGKNKRRREKAKARKEGKGVVGGEKGSGGAAVDGVGFKGPNPLVAKKAGDDAEEQAGMVADEGGIIIHDDD